MLQTFKVTVFRNLVNLGNRYGVCISIRVLMGYLTLQMIYIQDTRFFAFEVVYFSVKFATFAQF